MLRIVQCSICGREVGRNMISFHEAKCPQRPEIDAAVRRCIADPEHPGYALERSRYDAVTTTISAGALIKQFGSWIAACRHYGLLPISARHSRRTGGKPPRDSKRLERLNAPLTDEERHPEHCTEADERYAEMMQPLGLPVCRVRTLPNGATSYVIR